MKQREKEMKRLTTRKRSKERMSKKIRLTKVCQVEMNQRKKHQGCRRIKKDQEEIISNGVTNMKKEHRHTT